MNLVPLLSFQNMQDVAALNFAKVAGIAPFANAGGQ
jgi:hypothetical protein